MWLVEVRCTAVLNLAVELPSPSQFWMGMAKTVARCRHLPQLRCLTGPRGAHLTKCIDRISQSMVTARLTSWIKSVAALGWFCIQVRRLGLF